VPLFFLRGKIGTPSSITYSSLSILISLGQKPNQRPKAFATTLMIFALACAIIAMARPQIQNKLTQHTASGIDIILAIDISYSMLITDFTLNQHKVDRITAAKATAAAFVKQRPHDRIGIIAFSGRPYLTSPITLEHDWLIEQKLKNLRPGLVKEQGTAIGSAIAASATRLNERESKSKVIVLLTDGSNNSGRLAPLEAAKHASKLGIKIYTIAIGTDDGRLTSGPIHPQKEFDTQTLKKIAQLTGGEYFRARDTAKLRDTFHSIDLLEKTTINQHTTVTTQEFFLYPTALALLLAILAITSQSLNPPPAP